MTTTEERVSRLEGSYEHVATKADIRRLEGKVDTAVANMEAMENRLMLKLVGSMVIIAGLTIAVMRFLG